MLYYCDTILYKLYIHTHIHFSTECECGNPILECDDDCGNKAARKSSTTHKDSTQFPRAGQEEDERYVLDMKIDGCCKGRCIDRWTGM